MPSLFFVLPPLAEDGASVITGVVDDDEPSWEEPLELPLVPLPDGAAGALTAGVAGLDGDGAGGLGAGGTTVDANGARPRRSWGLALSDRKH